MLGLLLLCLPTSLFAATIFVVDSYHPGYGWTAECREGLEYAKDSQHQLIYAEMDTKRISPSLFAARAEAIWQQIQKTAPQLVIAMDDNALKYLGQRVSDAGIPVVFMGVNQNPRQYFEHNQIPQNVTGALERPLLKQNLVILSQLLPVRAKRMLLLMDSGVTSQAILASSLDGRQGLTIESISLDTQLVGTFEEWQAKVNAASVEDYDALLITSYAGLKDSSGRHIPYNMVSEWTSTNSPLPVFTTWRYSVGKGRAIGGLVNSGFTQGVVAARIANKVLESGLIPYFERPANGEYLFSRYELARWQIELSSEIRKESQLLE